MPHKKNTISTEQMEGMARMAKKYFGMILENISTWEERAIEQSCVERVAWPDLFHVAMHSLKTMTKVLDGLVVFSDNMLLEIIESRGTYASDEAKELLKKLGEAHGLTAEECYRIIQLASFNVFEPAPAAKKIRLNPSLTPQGADQQLFEFAKIPIAEPVSIRDIIAEGRLRVSSQLSATEEDVKRWNGILKIIFEDEANEFKWHTLFLPSFLLRNEHVIYQRVIGTD